VTLLPIQQRILGYLDGRHTTSALATVLAGKVRPKELDEHLRFFAYAGLLVE
jgi:hypothetical protein